METLLKIAAKNRKGLATPFLVQESGMLVSADASQMMQIVSEPKKLDIQTYDGSNQPVHPAVVRMTRKWNNYKYWMAYTPYPYANEYFENPCIMASNDCETWVVPSGLTNPIVNYPSSGTPESHDRSIFNRDPQLIFAPDENNNNGRLYLYWSRNGLSPIFMRAYSDNGKDWTIEEGTDLDVWGIVRKSASDWECFRKNGENGFTKWISTDGINWKRDNMLIPTNLTGNIWHHSVFFDNTGYHFLAVCYPKGATIENLTLFYGFSKDGTNIVFDSTPILIAKDNSFYSEKLYQSVLIPYEDNIYKVFFSCASEESIWSIGSFDAIISAPAAKYNLQRSPKPETTERWILYQAEVRDSMKHNYLVPELSEYPNKILCVYNGLKDSNDTAVSVTISPTCNVRTMNSNYDQQDGVTIAGSAVSLNVGGSGYFSDIYTKNELAVLGVMMPSKSGFDIKCSAVPTSGTISILIKAWA